jgi:kynurenine formamidase
MSQLGRSPAAAPRTHDTPAYRDLPELEGERCAWDVFGRDDDLGTLNWIDAGTVARAAASVRSGQVVNLDLPLDFGSQLTSSRRPMDHVLVDNRLGMDDYIDGFYPQSSSQWDGFRHIRFREHGYYGGHRRADFDGGAPVLGVAAWAERGIVGRGVLLDIAAWAEETGHPWDPAARSLITPEVLDDVLRHQGTVLERGDILMLRTGWLTWFRSLAPHRETAAWLWDRGTSAVAADNPALEALPVRREEGFLHRRLLTLLGMPIGEYWDLDGLAAAGRRLARYHGLLVSSPLNLPGGVGSPCNAYMIL